MHMQSKIRILAALAKHGPATCGDLLKPSRCTPGVLAVRLGELKDEALIYENSDELIDIADAGRSLLRRAAPTDNSKARRRDPPTLRSALTALDNAGPVTFRPLADAMGIDKNSPHRSQLQKLIKKAIERGMVERGHDLRYTLTNAGARYIEGGSLPPRPKATPKPDNKPTKRARKAPAIIKSATAPTVVIVDPNKKAPEQPAPARLAPMPDQNTASLLVNIADQVAQALKVNSNQTRTLSAEHIGALNRIGRAFITIAEAQINLTHEAQS